MSDPRRWLDDAGSATRLERDLLGSGLEVDPPDGAKAAIWAALAAGVLAGGGAAGAAGAAAASAANGAAAGASLGASAAGASAAPVISTFAGIKGVLLAIAIAAAGGGVYVLGGSPAPAPSAAPARAAAPVETLEAVAPPAPLATQPEPEPPPPAEEPARDAPTRPAAKASAGARSNAAPGNHDSNASAVAKAPEPAASSRVHEESLLVGRARQALRGGQAREALRLLEEARTQFPSGVLGQEREALSIEALALSGNKATARKRAQAFIDAFPNSPHAARVARFR